jgi:type VII secretion protein EccB
VARYPANRLEVSGHRFLRRRLEHALVDGDAGRPGDPVRPQPVSLVIGAGVAVLAIAGCAVLGWLRPQPGLGDAAIVMDQASGALYVRIEDTVHPVLNLTSARLIAQAADDPQHGTAADLADAKHGALLGIPGAPAILGPALSGAESGWTVCDGAVTTVVAGPVRAAAQEEPLLVSGRSGTSYLLYDGSRAVVDLTDPGTVHALHLDGVEPRPVSPAVLSLVPEVPPITAPTIPDVGLPGPSALPGFAIGDVVRVEQAESTAYFVVLAGGVQQIGAVAADVIHSAVARPGADITTVAPTAINQVPRLGVLPVSEFPERIGRPRGRDVAVLCTSWTAGAVSVSVVDGLPLDGRHAAVSLAQADGDGPAVDAVYVPPGRSVYVSSSGLPASTGSVIAETGVRFPIGDADAVQALGLPEHPEPAPWSLLALLPTGPELRRDAALVARDVIAPTPP